jgi:hypothetical protein
MGLALAAGDSGGDKLHLCFVKACPAKFTGVIVQFDPFKPRLCREIMASKACSND